jgi:hypothetical protein
MEAAMLTTVMIGFAVALASMLAGFQLGVWATRESGKALAGKPVPDGWAARCGACGVPIGYEVTWNPAVLTMRKDQKDRIKFDLRLTFAGRTAEVPSAADADGAA